jgi:hypothetical protein
MTDPLPTHAKSSPSANRQVTREQLYEEVWREPMLKVCQRHGVSSSFLARVCSALNVPRPQRGYWAKLEFGKDPGERPPLPEARVEDKLVWNRTHEADIVRRPLPVVPVIPRKRRSTGLLSQPKVHTLTAGARDLFTKGRKTETGLLKPSKKLLVDLVVTETLLDEMLTLANCLFQRLEIAGHRVVIAPADFNYRRADVDEREVLQKSGYRHDTPSAPLRPTIVLIGTVAIGLTLFEMTEELEAQYIGNSGYVPLALLSTEQRKLAVRNNYWTSKKDYATGRMCVQAYSPYQTAHWVTHWRESRPKELEKKLSAIVKALESAAEVVANLVVEGKRQAEIQRLQREEEWQRHEAEQERRRKAKATVDSRAELLSTIASWSEAKRIHAFFSELEAEGQQLDAVERALIENRLNQARELIGRVDVLETLRKWKAPDER